MHRPHTDKDLFCIVEVQDVTDADHAIRLPGKGLKSSVFNAPPSAANATIASGITTFKGMSHKATVLSLMYLQQVVRGGEQQAWSGQLVQKCDVIHVSGEYVIIISGNKSGARGLSLTRFEREGVHPAADKTAYFRFVKAFS